MPTKWSLSFWLLLVIFLSDSTYFSNIAAASRSSSRKKDSKADGRQGKFLSVFQIIRFANDPCVGSGAKNGTCFTEQECSARGGTNGGSCAQGFGICCIVTLTCGQMSSENCTYFDSNAAMAGSCQATICPCNDNICQLRLDFNNFVISGPSTNLATVTKRKAQSGVVLPGGLVGVTAVTQCLTDTFSVSNGDGPNPPTICGTNTGEHMYVESNTNCNTLTFQLGAMGVGTMVAARAWSIKVTQYSCNFNNLAPQGCVQYFFGNAMDNIMTFNYDGGNGVHLADQDQQICIRRERQFCRICYEVLMNGQFDVSGLSGLVASLNTGGLCCSYSKVTSATLGFDCLHIPGALNKSSFPNKSNFCGNNKLKTTTMAGVVMGNTGKVCSTRLPFSVNFRSDAHEVAPEAGLKNSGFTIQYTMDAMGCQATAAG